MVRKEADLRSKSNWRFYSIDVLFIFRPGQQQFNSPKNVVKTGGTTWAGPQMPGNQPMMNWPAGAPGAGVQMNQWPANTTGMPGMPGVMPQAYGVQVTV